MSGIELLPEPFATDDPHSQVAFIVFSSTNPDTQAVLWCTKSLADEFRDSRSDNLLAYDTSLPDDVEAEGVWVWEGGIFGITYPSTPNGPEEYDVVYRGVFRRPTSEEWAWLFDMDGDPPTIIDKEPKAHES